MTSNGVSGKSSYNSHGSSSTSPNSPFPQLEFVIPSNYDFSLSTEENYSVTRRKKNLASPSLSPVLPGACRPFDEEVFPTFVGKYALERSLLDYSYHCHYIEERQLLHDQMIDKFHKTIVHDVKNDWYCESPEENWIVFTAGACLFFLFLSAQAVWV
jgi:hypothetical protein